MKKQSITICNGPSKGIIVHPVKTEPFVWHITHRDRLEDHSISRDGLLCPEGGAVYAHHKLKRLSQSYPYVLDVYEDWCARIEKELAVFCFYSYWRIDTRIAGIPWYQDPFMGSDAMIHGLDPRIFICTPNPVPPAALKLFHFKLDGFKNPELRISYAEGVASIGGDRGDLEGFYPHIK